MKIAVLAGRRHRSRSHGAGGAGAARGRRQTRCRSSSSKRRSAASRSKRTAIRCRRTRWRSRARPTRSCSAPAAFPATRRSPTSKRPGAALLRLRKDLDLFANFRPAFLFPGARGRVDAEAGGRRRPRPHDPARAHGRRRTSASRAAFGTDANGAREAFNTMRYSEPEVERIAHVAFRTARAAASARSARSTRRTCSRRCSCGATSSTRVGSEYPDVELTHMFVDAAAMQLMRAPDAVRRHRHRQRLRRHPLRRGRDAHRLDRHASVRVARAAIGAGLYEPVHGIGARHRRARTSPIRSRPSCRRR